MGFKPRNVVYTLIGILLFSFSAFSMNGRTTYQAKIVKPDGSPLEASNVTFKFSVLDTVGSCVLYTETYSAVNMTSTGGLVSFALGNGARGFPGASATTAVFSNVFDNSITSMPCEPSGIYNPLSNDTRRIVMQFNDGTTGWQTLPAMTINAVPYAMYAAKSNDSRTLNGKADTAFVENATLASLNCNTATHAITFNGASFSCIAVGGASQTQIINTLGYAPVSSSAVAIQISTAFGGVTSSQVLSSVTETAAASSSNVANAIVKRDSFGNSSFSGITAGTANLDYVDIYKPNTSFNIRLQAPTSLAANFTLSLPNTSGTTGQVLSTDGSGNLSWVNPSNSVSAGITLLNGSSATTQTFSIGAAGTAPQFNTAAGVHTLNIPLASSTSVTAGLISNQDYLNFAGKITSSSASIAQVLGYIPASATNLTNYVLRSNDLSDLASATVARNNLGLGDLATLGFLDLSSSLASGTLAVARLPAFTGDATIAAASNTIVLSNTGVTAGTYTKLTVDNKGRVTSSSALASSDITAALGYSPVSAAAATQWATSGSTISYSLGNVGIGTTNPGNSLSVSGNSTTSGFFRVGSAMNPANMATGDLTSNRLSVGNATITAWGPNSVANISASINTTSGTVDSAMSIQANIVPTADSSVYARSLVMSNNFNTISNVTAAGGSGPSAGWFENRINSAGNIAEANGLNAMGIIVPSSATAMGTVTDANGIFTRSANSFGNPLTSTITKGVGIRVAAPILNTLTMTNSIGVAIDPLTNATNNTSLLIGQATAPAGNYGIYNSSTSSNYFAGNVGIGTSAPAVTLDVQGTAGQIRAYGSAGGYDIRMNTSGGTSLGSWSNSDLIVNTNATEKMRITTAGNVGIGTTAPNTALDVSGVIRSSGASSGFEALNPNNSSASVRLDWNGDVARIRWGGTGAGSLNGLRLQGTGDVTKMAILENGNVGIGTVTPSARLHLTSGTSVVASFKFTSGTLLSSPASGSVEYDGFNLYYTDGTNTRRTLASVDSTGTQNNTSVLSNSGNITLAPTGSVIVSSTTASTNANTGALIVSGGVGVAGNIFASGTIVTSSNIEGASITALNGVSTTVITGVPSLALNPYGGSVGIGMLGSLANLHILRTGLSAATPASGSALAIQNNGTVSAVAIVNLLGGTSGSGAIFFGDSVTPNRGMIAYDNSSNALRFSTTTASERMRIDSSGNVAIGTTTPSARLTVSGTGATAATASLHIVNGVSSSLMYVRDDGNVGIGTTAPGSTLEVNSSSVFGGAPFRFLAANLGFDYTSSIVIGRDYSSQRSAVIGYDYTSAAADRRLTLGTYDSPKALVMNTAGNVGIGMITPTARLTVSGTGATSATASLHIINGASSSLMFVRNDGNVGIGTTTPGLRAEVRGIYGLPANSGIAQTGVLRLSQQSSTGVLDLGIGGASGASWLQATDSNGLNNNLQLLLNPNGGNVGIGTSTPNARLTVSGAGATSATASLHVVNSASSSLMYVRNDGNVGISTMTPREVLEVGYAHYFHVGGVIAQGFNSYWSNSNSRNEFGGYGSNKYAATTNFDHSTGLLIFRNSSNSGNAGSAIAWNTGLAMDSSGNVGINTTTPSYKLDVSGTINIASGSALAFGGTSVCTAAGCTSSSDERLKENIKPLDFDLNKLLSLNAVEYDWKNKAKYGEKHQIGFIAQDLEKAYPEVVYTDKNTGLKSVTYGHLVAPIIEALKSLYKRIVNIEDRLTGQDRQITSIAESKADKEEIEKLKSENAALKAYLCSKDPKASICQ